MSRYTANIITKSPATPTGPTTTGRAPGIWRMDDVAYWTKQGLWPNANIQAPDTYFPYVSLLLSTTSLGNANNNLFVDSSGAFNPVSRNGNTTQGSFTPYATNWSNYFDGSGDYLTISTNAAFGYGTGDFTIEFWLNLSGVPAAMSVVSNLSSASGTSPHLYIATDGTLRYYTASVDRITSSVVPLQQWIHVALCRSSGSTRMFFNGVQTGSTYSDSNNYGSSNPVGIATYWNGTPVTTNTLFGYLSNLRILKGVGLYTTTFTPPTSPLTAISGTSLLTCQSNRFRDASTNSFTITAYGTSSVQDFNPFSPAYPGLTGYNQSDITNWSGYFDGSGDWLTVPNNTALQFGSGDFTVEFWANVSASSGFRGIIGKGGAATGWAVFIDNNNYWAFSIDNLNYAGSVTPTYGTWTHVAFTRSGTTFTLYINGTSVRTQTSSSSFTQTEQLVIGAGRDLSIPYTGYISNVRVVKGTAVYTGNFTPPTTNLTAISGTSLLTLQNAAFTDNSTNNFVITPNGNVTVTGNSPFNTVGYWSNYFNGTNSRMSIADNAAFGFGTGNFTVEFWLNYTGGNGYKFFFVNNSGSGNYVGYGLQINTLTPWVWNNGDVLVASSNITPNTWQHHAVVRNGSTLTIYLNGTAIGSTTWTVDLGTSRPFYIGWNGGNDNQSTPGYFSNFRVVKGTAVYTSNFTPPTAPLTAISGTSALTCQNGRFIDNSTNNFAVTVSGTVLTQPYNPFYTSTIASNGGSMYFDGSGDYLALQSNPNYALGSGDFTLEVWVYPIVQGGHGSSNNDCIIDFRPAANGAYGTLYSVNNGTSINWYANTAVQITGGAIPNNAWSHLMVSRVSGSTRLFINGVQSGSTYADSTNYLQTNPWVGQFNDGIGSGWFQGYMSGMRIVKGSGVSSTFTPPTAPQTPTAATTLLLNGMNAGIYDATAINDMETVGNAQTRNLTPFPPANYYAGYFDGSGDYLATGTSSAIALGTADFTFECWVYPSSYPNDSTLVYAGGTSTGNEISLQIRNSQVAAHLYISGSHSDVQFTDLPVSLNTWSHLAISRVSGVLYGFLNGVRSSTAPSLTANFGTSAAAYVAVGNRYAGSISNARITKNAAVYSTSTYTVPTSPLDASANTAFLTCQNKTFIDNSPNALPITVYGGATAGVSGPFTYTGASSVYFGGGSNRLQIPINPQLYLGATYTIEAWIYANSFGRYTPVFTEMEAFQGGFAFMGIYTHPSGQLATTVRDATGGTVYEILSASALSTATWYHVAMSVSNGTMRQFINGVQQGSTLAVPVYPVAKTVTAAVGGWGSGWSDANNGSWDGYIDDFRITRGVARYTSNFTPPTQPFPVY